MTVPDSAYIEKMENFFFNFLTHKHRVGKTGFEIMLDREEQKVESSLKLRPVQNQLKAQHLTVNDIKNHVGEMRKRYLEKPFSTDDWICFFHVPPSIYHLHMHCALKDKEYRKYSVCELDKSSFPADAVKKAKRELAEKKPPETCKKINIEVGKEDGIIRNQDAEKPQDSKPS
jgi:hypothetical protein